MNMVIVVNDQEIELPVPQGYLVPMLYSHLAPYEWKVKVGLERRIVVVIKIRQGVFLRVYSDGSLIMTESGDWMPPVKEYLLVITQPELVGKPLSEFTTKEQAWYGIARIIRDETGEVMTKQWKTHFVDQLPEIIISTQENLDGSIATFRGGSRISEFMVLLTMDGWNADHSEQFERALYVLKGTYSDLA